MIYLDFETRSKADIKKTGAWAYAQHPSTEVLCMAYAVDDGDVKLWTPKEPFPIEFDNTHVYEAHNAEFEQAIWKSIMEPVFNLLPIEEWECSAAKCATHSLPRGLDKAGMALDLPIQKNQDGKRLMLKMSKPRKPTKNDPSVWHEAPEDLQKLYEYCMDDVRAERAISKALLPLNEQEKKLWKLDQKINAKGITIDHEAVRASLVMADHYCEYLNSQLPKLTNGAVNRASEAKKLTIWIQSRGVGIQTVKKSEVKDTLENVDLPEDVREVLEIRQKVGKTSVAKYKAITKALCKDNTIKGALLYCGATTGRWTGKIVQPQNLPRNEYTGKLKEYFAILKNSSPEIFSFLFPKVMDVISFLIRPCLIPSKGNYFFGGDYSSIEARTLLWLAEDKRALQVFIEGGDIYKDLASIIYDIPANEISKDSIMRMVGKQGILGLGYGMGAEKFQETCANYGIHIDISLAEKVKNTYRSTYYKVKNMWTAQEKAAIEAVVTGEMRTCGKIKWGVHGHFLFCKLPSKRLIAYYRPEIQLLDTPWGQKKETLTYMSTNSVTRKFERTKTYGGKLVENITQGVARDIMAEAMLRLDEKGYSIAFHTHDEIATEHSKGSVSEFEDVMCQLPTWAEGLPIEVDGWTGERYLK